MLTPAEIARVDRAAPAPSGATDIGLYGGMQETFEPLVVAPGSSAEMAAPTQSSGMPAIATSHIETGDRADGVFAFSNSGEEMPSSPVGSSAAAPLASVSSAVPAQMTQAIGGSTDATIVYVGAGLPFTLTGHGHNGFLATSVTNEAPSAATEPMANAAASAAAPANAITPVIAATPTAVAETTQAIVSNVGAATDALRASIDSAIAEKGEAVALLAETIAAPLASAGAIGESVSAIAETAAALQGSIQDTIAEQSETITTAVETVTAGVDHTLSDLAATASSAVEEVAAAIGDTTGDLADRVDAHIAGVTEISSVATEAAVDSLAGLAGNDPAAGIATLVSLVSAADMFAMHDDGSAIDGFGSAIGAIGEADLLADLVPGDILLGVTDHHDDLPGQLGLDGLASGLDDLGLGL